MEKLNDINILYEDNHLLVVVKPHNLPTCLDNSQDEDLLTLLKKYLKDKYQKPGNVYLGLIHRLDRPVTGIMVFAKTSKAASRLTTQIQNHQFKKTYFAIVEGSLPTTATLEDYLLKDERTNTSTITKKNNGKLARLTYQVIATKNNLSLIKINLETGRHHQIRVQFASRHHPLYGDHKYNKNFINDKTTNIALIAANLSFYHPTTKEQLTFNINLPKKYPWNLF